MSGMFLRHSVLLELQVYALLHCALLVLSRLGELFHFRLIDWLLHTFAFEINYVNWAVAGTAP